MLALVLGCGAFLRFERARTADSFGGGNYYALGFNVRNEGVLAYPANPRLPSAYRAPLFPDFIGLFCPNSSVPMPRRVLYAQALLGTLAIGALYVLGSALHSPMAGLLAAGMYAFSAEQIRYGASLEVEHFHAVFLLAVACALVYWFMRPSQRSSWGLGLLIGFSLNCRSSLFLFPFLLAVACPLLQARFRLQGRLRLGVVILAAAATLVPWTVRNAKHFKEFVPFERYAAACNIFTASEGMSGTLLPMQAQALAGLGDRTLQKKSEDERNRELLERALANVVARPWRYLAAVFERCILIVGTHPWLWILSLAGLWSCRGDPRLYPLALLVAYFCGMHALLSFEGRYLVPIVPELQVMSACALASFGAALARRWKQPWRWSESVAENAHLRGTVQGALILGCGIYAASVFFLVRELGQKGLTRRADVQTSSEGVFPRPGEKPERFFNDRGVQRYLSGDLAGAESDFRRACAITPDYVEPRLSLAAVLGRRGAHEEAAEACAQAVRLSVVDVDSRPPARKEALMLYASSLECSATELQALGRSRDAQFFREADRRFLASIARRP
jgi:hypothetical protein